MSEIPSFNWYRQFQRIALVLGVCIAGIGALVSNSAVFGGGAIVLIHALIASLIIFVEDRRRVRRVDQRKRE